MVVELGYFKAVLLLQLHQSSELLQELPIDPFFIPYLFFSFDPQLSPSYFLLHFLQMMIHHFHSHQSLTLQMTIHLSSFSCFFLTFSQNGRSSSSLSYLSRYCVGRLQCLQHFNSWCKDRKERGTCFLNCSLDERCLHFRNLHTYYHSMVQLSFQSVQNSCSMVYCNPYYHCPYQTDCRYCLAIYREFVVQTLSRSEASEGQKGVHRVHETCHAL